LPDPVFDGLKGLLEEEESYGRDDMYFIPKFFLDEFETMSTNQQSVLLTSIKKIYPKYRDATTCMVMAEILATCIATDDSIRMLLFFTTITSPIPRAIAAYGLGCVQSKGEFSAKILERLEHLKTDSSTAVREEAVKSLRRLKRRNK
jgi:hypothetical protein